MVTRMTHLRLVTKPLAVNVSLAIMVFLSGCSGSDETTTDAETTTAIVQTTSTLTTTQTTDTTAETTTTTTAPTTTDATTNAPAATTAPTTTVSQPPTTVPATTAAPEPEPMTDEAVLAALDDYTRILNECFADAINCQPATLQTRASGRRLEADVATYEIIRENQKVNAQISLIRTIVPAYVEVPPDSTQATISICIRDLIPHDDNAQVRPTTRLYALHNGWIWKFDDASVSEPAEIEC